MSANISESHNPQSYGESKSRGLRNVIASFLILDENRTHLTKQPTIVYTSVSPGYIGIPNAGISFKCTKYGETFSVSRHQLDAIVGQYRKWFDDGRLALADKDAGVAKEKGIPTVGSFFLTRDTLANLGKLSTTELQNLWNKITLPEQRESLVHYYKQKYMEGDPEFKNREKIELLNRLTENGFASEAREVSGYGTKLTPKIFM